MTEQPDRLAVLTERAATGRLLASEGPALREAVQELRNQAEQAQAAEARLTAARALHQDAYGECTTCRDTYGNPDAWPCPTSEALNGPLTTR